VLRAGIARDRLSQLRRDILVEPHFEHWRQRMTDIMRDAVPVSSFFLAIASGGGNRALRVEYGCDNHGKETPETVDVLEHQSLFQEVFDERHTVCFDSRATVAAFGSLVEGSGSLVATPILNPAGGADGLIDLESQEENAFNEYTRDVLTALADLLGLSRAVTKLVDQERRLFGWRVAAERETVNSLRSASRTLAHSIKNPLHVLRASLSLLVEGDLKDAPLEMLDRVKARVERANYLCNEIEAVIGELAELGTSPRLDPRAEDLVKRLCERANHYQDLALASGVRFEMETPTAKPTVRIDPPQLWRALDVVVENAIEACVSTADSTTGNGLVRMKLDADPQSRMARITVTDTGPGISDESFSQLFDPLFSMRGMAHSPRGMGLFLARNIVTEHGGTIHADEASKEGHGATFVICLPTSQGLPEGASHHE